MKYAITLLTGALLAAASVPGPAFEKARALYYKGSDGDHDAYAQASKLFDRLRAKRPDDPRVEVYAGSLRLWEASHTWAIWKKNSLSKEGIQMMDSAAQADPKNLEIRFVRAITEFNLPSFFHRREHCKQEFAALAAQAPAAASSGAIEPRLAAASLYYHGLFLQEASDRKAAESAWKEAISTAPDSRAAREATEELKKIAR